MKRILMVSCEGLGNGGVQSVMMSIVRSLSSKYRFDMVLTTDERRYYDDEFESLGGKIFRFPIPKNRILARLEFYLRGLRLYFGLQEIMKNEKYDAIHCNNEFYAAFCLKAAERAGVPIRVCHTHIINPQMSKLQNSYNQICRKMINKYATCKIGCSEKACEVLYGIEKHSIVVNNPYDSHKFIFYPKRVSESPILMQIGSYSKNKNQLFSLDIVAELKNRYPNILLYMMGFGKGEYVSEIHARIQSLDLQDNVFLYSGDSNAAVLLRDVDCLLFPSKNEGFGIVAIEAQAVGVRVFASDTIPKAIDCGGVVFLSLNEGAKKWAEKIIEDYEFTHGEHKSYDCTAFSLEKVMEVYQKVYEGE